MCVCTYACVGICACELHVLMYAYMHYMYEYVHMYVCLCICIYVVYIRMCVCVRARMCMGASVGVYVCMHVPLCMCLYMGVCIKKNLSPPQVYRNQSSFLVMFPSPNSAAQKLKSAGSLETPLPGFSPHFSSTLPAWGKGSAWPLLHERAQPLMYIQTF